jgi:hypothetical protein
MSVGPAITQDGWGATAIPLVAPATFQVVGQDAVVEAAGDPLLSYGLSFFATVANAYGSAAWNAPGIAPGVEVVANTFPHNPREESFNEKDLPAMYMWRDGATEYDQIAQDLRVVRGTISLLWVAPVKARQTYLRLRSPFPKALLDVLEDCFERGCDLNWQLVGDTSPSAVYVQTYGSLLWPRMNFRRMHFQKWSPASLTVPAEGGPRTYRATQATLYVEELYTQGAGYSPLLALDQKIQVTDQGAGDGGFIIAEGVEPEPD